MEVYNILLTHDSQLVACSGASHCEILAPKGKSSVKAG